MSTATDAPDVTGASTATGATRQLIAQVQGLSNDQLTSQLTHLNRKQHRLIAELLLHLGELDARRLYRELACASPFEYLTARLGQSEDVAYRWMWGARLLRAFPLAYELLADGRLHLSGLMLLKPHLNQDNQREWLLAATGKSKREIERMVAARYPKADVPTQVRRLPEPDPNRLGHLPESRQNRGGELPEPNRVSELPKLALAPGDSSRECPSAVESLSSVVPSIAETSSESSARDRVTESPVAEGTRRIRPHQTRTC